MFITDSFIWKWRTKRILIPSTFVDSFCLSTELVSKFVSWTADRLFGWLFSYLFPLFGWSVGFGWLVGFSSPWCWLTAHLTAPWSFHSLVSQEHKSSTDHKGWQSRCNWTSQIWNVVHCLGALDCDQCTYTYNISQLLRKVICFHSWIDNLLIFSIILVWQLVENFFYKLLSRSVLHVEYYYLVSPVHQH